MAQRPEDPKPEDQTEGKEAAETENQDGAAASQGGEAEVAGTETPSADASGSDDADSDASDGAAERIIAQFGGIRPMAHKLEVPVTTVQGWKKRGVIPEPRHAEIRQAAEARGIELDADVLRLAAGQDEAAAGTQATTDAQAPDGASDGTAEDASARDGELTQDSGTTAPAETTAAAGEPSPPVEDPLSGRPSSVGDNERSAAATAAAATVPVAPDQPSPSRSQGGGGWGAALVAVAAAIIAILVPLWGPTVLPSLWAPTDAGAVIAELQSQGALPDVDAAISPVQTEVDALSERFEALETAGGAAGGDNPAAAAAFQALLDRVTALEAAVAEVSVDTVDDRVTALEGAFAAASANEVDPAVVEALQARVDAVAADLAALNGAVDSVSGAMPDVAAALSPVVSRIDAHDTGIAAAQAAAASAQTAADAADGAIDALSGRVSAVEAVANRVAAGLDEEQALSIAFGQFREDVATDSSFAVSYATLANLLADHPDLAATLAPLSDRAASGIATRAALASQFPDLANEVLIADRTTSDPSDLDIMIENLQSLVTIRRAPDLSAGDRPSQVLSRAEFHVRNGDLAEAIAEMAALEGRAGEAAAAWIGEVRARLDADAALDAIGRIIIERLAAGAETGEAQ